ncbi:MAG: hypothetical protein A7316_06860 [Candidatus Altiarchaeales archaeon WOR_SM1_86-2]|nr:MAG: hypothetical protein A7316_06860 [Candidatus Altiarchaeales archaeon WOR_SM1_86-2]ODS41637.1 MAG: hypothetical protein A7315_01035 [Candidatus Altiarchaeales archaeon WOR_SM1_79]
MKIFRLKKNDFWWVLPVFAFILTSLDYLSTFLSASRYGLYLECNQRMVVILGLPLHKLILVTILTGLLFAFSTLLLMLAFRKFNSSLPELQGRLMVSAQSSVVLNNMIIFFLGFSYINNMKIFFPLLVWITFLLINKKYSRIIAFTLLLSYSTCILIYLIFGLSNFQYFVLPLFLNLIYVLPVKSVLKSI